MKILFLEEAANLGGARIATVDLAANINNINGYEAFIVDVSGTCKPFIDYCKDKGVNVKIVDQREKPLICSTGSKIKNTLRKAELLLRIITVRRNLRRIIEECQPDYIILNSYRRLLYLYGIKCRAKICFYAHGWYISQQISKFQKILLKTVPDRIICVSEATKHALYSNGILPLNKIQVVHNGIDISKIRKDVATITGGEGKFKILHCGGFTVGKSQLISVEIAKQLRDIGFKFKLIFTGIIYADTSSKKYYQQVVDAVNRYELQDCVEFVIGRSNVIDYFRASDVLIHPSETEGLPLVVMEAMAVKLPVIANSVGGVTDYILNGFTGILPRHDDVDDYVYWIKKLAEDNEFRSRIIENAYNLVANHFTVARQFESFIKALK